MDVTRTALIASPTTHGSEDCIDAYAYVHDIFWDLAMKLYRPMLLGRMV